MRVKKWSVGVPQVYQDGFSGPKRHLCIVCVCGTAYALHDSQLAVIVSRLADEFGFMPKPVLARIGLLFNTSSLISIATSKSQLTALFSDKSSFG